MDQLCGRRSGFGGRHQASCWIMNIRARSRLLLLVAACSAAVTFALTSQAQVTDVVSVVHMQGRAPIAPDAISVLGTDMFGDSINLFTGSFSFEQTDLSLPGNSALPVALIRTHSPGRAWQVRGSAADWDLNTPRIEATFPTETGWIPSNGNASQRCSSNSALSQPMVTVPGGWSENGPMPGVDFLPWEYGTGINIVVPGHSSQEVLRRASGNTLAPTDGNSYPFVSAKNWQIGCLSSIQNGAGQGFMAVSPDGTRYRFDWMALRAAANIYKSGTGVARADIYLMATQVTDRFGNWVRYTYDPAKPLNLTQIEANDGRLITLSYSGGFLSSASDGTRTVAYTYKSDGDLQSVTQPDGSAWSFNLRSFFNPIEPYFDGYVDCDSMPQYMSDARTGSITHPSGAVGTFVARNVGQGRTNVTRACTYDNASGWTTGSMYAKTTVHFALQSKEITGPSLTPMTWHYTQGYNSEYGEWGPCSNCLDRKAVTVTNPDGTVNRHIFGIKWRVNEGQLLQLDEGWNGSSALRTTQYRYREPAGQDFADRLGDSEYFWSNYLTSRNRPQDRRVITQQDVEFTWQVDSSAAGFDVYARPKTISKSSSLGTRIEQIQYSDLTSAWVLGQVASVTELQTGKVILAHAYSNALQTSTSAFGLQKASMTYNGDGTLSTVSDGAGKTTTFQNFMRGKPQYASFADSSGASTVVNNLGSVASFTNEVGSSITYSFDAMGRVSQVQQPTGDPVAYTPTIQSFMQVPYAEYGLPAGHWRQTITTGNATTVRRLDAMWRVRLEHRYDAGDPASTSRFLETRYDSSGRVAFRSYPSRRFDAIDGLIAGTQFSYDALNRLVQQVSDSEIGPLTEATEYLPGYQRRGTNARGHVTTTAFQAFDEPSEENPTQISAPEGVHVTIVRDVFGKAKSITRSGSDASVIRQYVYDAHERLCKTIEPEVGTTVQDYDAAGNLAWRATGLTLPDPVNCNRDAVPAVKKIVHSYDPRNRIIGVSYGDGSPSISRSYWADGALKTTNTSAGANWSFNYNRRRLLTSETLNNSGQGYTITRDYNALGHLEDWVIHQDH